MRVLQLAKRGIFELRDIPKKIMSRIQLKFGWSARSSEFEEYSKD